MIGGETFGPSGESGSVGRLDVAVLVDPGVPAAGVERRGRSENEP
jgi:hypothetical protein